ncbi:MAG: 16S rRNA (cytosine(1402)-N(4))-methyltransferase RsmH [Treponema sp.]|nr:16S rRNA (cytosine(1402)-N(4))-methyltransferase RsmH [Treponema sp.]MCL2272110.1 16S rRNA (cytosine(1402)-N(4))-methyltransferase RsmH [Treponema sp.]
MEYIHIPVLPEESLKLLFPRSDNDLMIDANTGEGGHSFNFLSRFPRLKMVCIDADSSVLAIAEKRLEPFTERVHFYSGWSHDFFAEYPSELKRPDTILFDLGVSLYHYRESGRGFSFEKDEYLDMRIDKEAGITAADLIAKLPEKELADLIYNNAGERYSRRIASRIVNERNKSTITTTSALAALVERAVPASYRHRPIHPATRTFQALRIAVNGELSKLSALLEGALRVLEPGGRLGVISFHSLEDRIVKNFFRTSNKNCTCPQHAPICRCEGRRSVNLLTKKGIAPCKEEIERNPSSRSARLRVAEKVLDEDGE